MPLQDNWRWCHKCQALAFAGSPTLGPCKAGGHHDHTGSGDYTLVQNDPAVPEQDNWRWCHKCQVLAFAGSATLGPCAAGGSHDHTGSGDYLLPQLGGGTLGQHDWRWCHKCQVLSFAGNGTVGPCAAGGVHSYTGSGDYVLAQNPQQALDIICDDTRCVSVGAVYANIAARLDGKVVGYACSVGRSLTYQAHGHARTSADAPAQAFLSSTKIPVASVSKVVTALTAIRVLAKNSVSLDAGIGGHLPSDWVLDPYVASITFRQLLSHTSGIKDYGNVSQDYAALKKFFTQKVDPTKSSPCTGPSVVDPPDPFNPNNHAPCYSNYNFSIFRVLLPIIDGFVDDPANRAAKLAAAYVGLAQKHVFEPVGALNVDAKPPTSGPQATAYAFSYAFPGTAPGFDWGDDTLQAGAAGWYLAVEDIAKVLASLNKDDGKVLSDAQLVAMEAKPLGWDTKVDGTGYRWVEKNGGWGANGTTISTSIALFGPGVIGVLFMNSDIAGEPGVGASTVLHDAYMAALTPRP